MSVDRVKKYYSVKEIAEIFGFSAKMVRNSCRARGVRFAVKMGNRYFIDYKLYKAYIERKRLKGV